MRAVNLRVVARGFAWTGVVAIFVLVSLLVASCQEKQETAQTDEILNSPPEPEAVVMTPVPSANIEEEVACTETDPAEEPAPTAEVEKDTDEEFVDTGSTDQHAEPGDYEIAWGDNLWSISERFYGTHVYWKLLAEWNGIQDHGAIRAGAMLEIPPVSEFPYQLYEVGEGDNLTFVSQAFYGSPECWDNLAEANGLTRAHQIQAGAILKIPHPAVESANVDSARVALE